jgi:hypothetical protein
VQETTETTTKTRPSARRARPQCAPILDITVQTDESMGTSHRLVQGDELVVELEGCDELMAHRIAAFLSGRHAEHLIASRELVQAVEALDETYPDEAACDRAWERLDTAAGATRRALRRVR